MPSFEKKLITWLEKHMEIILIIVLSVIAVLIRILLSRLHAQVPDAGADTRFTMMFDYALAVSAGALAAFTAKKAEGRRKGFLVYMLMLMSFGNVFASAIFGRWDSLWAAFGILAVLFLLKGKNLYAFAALSAACLLSSYALMLVPLFFFVYMTGEKYSIVSFIMPAAASAVRMVSGVDPGSWLPEGFSVKRMYVAFPSFWGFISTDSGSGFEHYMPAAVVACMIVLAAFFMIYCRKRQAPDNNKILWIAFLTCYITAAFMPGMGAAAFALCSVLSWILALSDAVLIIPALIMEVIRIWPQAARIYGEEWLPFSIQILCWIQTALLLFYLLYFNKKVLDLD